MGATRPAKKKTVVFLHPDLGIGGAERLVVDAAVGLQNRGHKVVIFTSHCDPKHCFDEARDGTLDVRVRGNTLFPASILSRFAIICAILRQLHLIIQISLTGELRALQPSHFFIDQLSAGVPLLQLLNRYFLPQTPPIFFYCHFPDLLLVQGRKSLLKRLYRLPFDTLEEWSTGCADAIAVNSKFTKGVVAKTWPGLAKRKELEVVYPCIDTGSKTGGKGKGGGEEELTLTWGGKKKIILSINRFERKKDVALAIKAFAGLSKEAREGVRLVIAGGYDNRVAENVTYHRELTHLATSLSLRHLTSTTIVSVLNAPDDADVLFLLSVPAALKAALLRSARLLVYTPANEHFGIVPLEAMLAGVPVLAANTGGPTETVVEGETGWLRSVGDVGEWTEVMDRVLNRMGVQELGEMKRRGVERVRGRFGDVQMAERLDGILDGMGETKGRSGGGGVGVVLVMLGIGVCVVAGVISVIKSVGS